MKKVKQENNISEDDLKILKIIKDHKKDIFNNHARPMGMETWFRDFYISDSWAYYSLEERFKASDMFNKLDFMFGKLVYETKLTEGLD
jgi:hypothetical protein